jgi:hypothetical protein
VAKAAAGPKAKDVNTRQYLAVGIVVLSIAGITAISWVVIALADDASRPEMARMVFSAVLPLLGTWVGTVLAFYFARDNLQAATESTLALVGDRLDQKTPVTAVMIPAGQIVAYDLGADEQASAVLLKDIHSKMTGASPPRQRLPIRNVSGAAVYVIHESTLLAFAQSVGEAPDSLTKTLGELLAVQEYKELVEAMGFVAETATIAEARTAMASVKQCNDVFVTSHGKREEPVIGWLTNTLLAGVE